MRWAPVIINRTDFRGDDLRRIVLRALTSHNARGTVRIVEFRHGTSFRTTGVFWIADKKIDISVPRGYATRADFVELLQVLSHEVTHALGFDHCDPEMPSWETLDVSWADGLQLRRRKNAPSRAKVEAYERRIRKLIAELDEIYEPRKIETRIHAPRKRVYRD